MTNVKYNPDLEAYLDDYITKNRLRYTYLRDRRRIKVGLVATFMGVDHLGRRDLYVGISKCAVNKGDKFNLQIGLAKAIQNALPCSDFLHLYDESPESLPRLTPTWRCVRDEHGYITGEVEWFDQYEAFASKLRRIYPTLTLTPSLSVVG